MKEGSREWWDARYQGVSDYLYGKAPSPFLVESIDYLRKGEALDIGTGEGRNAVYLASKGFKVTGIDFSETAGTRAKTLAKDSGVEVEFKTQDLDFLLIPIMKYDTIVVSDLHPPLTVLKGLARGLAKGGTLLLEGFLMDQARSNEGPKPDPIECYRPNEAIEYARELQILYYSELRSSPKEVRVRMLARKSER